MFFYQVHQGETKKAIKPRRSSVENMELVKVDSQRINTAIDAYYHWKDFDKEIRTLSGTRGVNLPSEISEYLACYAVGYYVNKNHTHGDAVDMSDPSNPRIIEIKGSSSEQSTAPNSFSPKEDFDELLFCRLIKRDDVLKIYKLNINSETIKEFPINSTQTFGEQQKQGRRPRFSIQNLIIEPYNIKPDAVFDIRRRQIIQDCDE